jgi:hypothetical protein
MQVVPRDTSMEVISDGGPHIHDSDKKVYR